MKLLYWLLAAGAVFALWQVVPALVSRESAPATRERAHFGEGAGQELSDSALGRLLQKLLADNIPGLDSPALAEGEMVRGAVLDSFRSLTGLDPRDPRSILEQELGIGVLVALPVLHAPSGTTPELPPERETADDEPEKPETTRPVFAQVFPFLGYHEPVALVYHTHITESFVPSSGVRFSDNLDQTVDRLGVELVRLLQEEYGLPLLHHSGVYDLPRRYAYEKARPVLEKILAENPQLELVIDLHRDGVSREITTTTVEGSAVGKILIVVGTRHPGWQSNFSFALRLHQELEALAPGISRGVRQQEFTYNQDLHPQAILIEAGGHENTMEEAMRSIPYLAEALARTYYLIFLQD